jgi:hypothetical protein
VEVEVGADGHASAPLSGAAAAAPPAGASNSKLCCVRCEIALKWPDISGRGGLEANLFVDRLGDDDITGLAGVAPGPTRCLLAMTTDLEFGGGLRSGFVCPVNNVLERGDKTALV